MSKQFFTAIVLLFAVSFNFYSQDSNPENTESTVQESQVNSDGTGATSEDVTDDYFSDNPVNASDFKSPSSLGTIVKMILFLILIIAVIYGLMWFFKRKSNFSKSDDDFMRRVSSLNLSPGKSVEIVTLLEHAYILGVTDNNINLLGEIEDKELVDALNLNFDKKQTVKKPMNFSDVLDMFMPNGPRERKNIFDDAEKKIRNLSKSKKEEQQVRDEK